MKKSLNFCFLGLSETKKSASSGIYFIKIKEQKAKCGGNKMKVYLSKQ